MESQLGSSLSPASPRTAMPWGPRSLDRRGRKRCLGIPEHASLGWEQATTCSHFTSAVSGAMRMRTG